MDSSFDTIVVGAGLAGLTAARDLTRAGQSVLVLEASNHIGGRTRTIKYGDTAFDIGGQWTGPGQPRVAKLLEEFGLKTSPTYVEGQRLMDLDGRLTRYSGTVPRMSPWKLLRAQLGIWKIERLCKRVNLDGPWNDHESCAWDGMTAGDWARQNVGNRHVIALVNAATRVVFGADMDELSFLHFLYYFKSGGGFTKLVESHEGNQDRFIIGGAQQLSVRLAQGAGTVKLESPVQRIAQFDEGTTVFTDTESWVAQHVVVAVPLPLADRIRYSPGLPTLRDQLTQRVSMGATVKCLALYERPFWRDQGLSGEAVCTQGPVSVAFDNTSPSGQAAIVAFVTGAPARGWSERKRSERIQDVLQCLVRFYGPEAAEPQDFIEQDWAAEPFIGGAPTANFPPGTLSVFGPALREPVGRIHWAGTETARESTGFMEGAIESGQRVAQEILASRNAERAI